MKWKQHPLKLMKFIKIIKNMKISKKLKLNQLRSNHQIRKLTQSVKLISGPKMETNYYIIIITKLKKLKITKLSLLRKNHSITIMKVIKLKNQPQRHRAESSRQLKIRWSILIKLLKKMLILIVPSITKKYLIWWNTMKRNSVK